MTPTVEQMGEMVTAFWAAHDDPEDGGTERGLIAAFDVLARDRRPECGAAGPDGKWCERIPHDPTEYHGWIGDGELVRW